MCLLIYIIPQTSDIFGENDCQLTDLHIIFNNKIKSGLKFFDFDIQGRLWAFIQTLQALIWAAEKGHTEAAKVSELANQVPLNRSGPT